MKINNISSDPLNKKSPYSAENNSDGDIKNAAAFSDMLNKGIEQKDKAGKSINREQAPFDKEKSTLKKDLKLMELSRELESVFINQMLKSMRKTVDKTDMMNGGTGEDIFTEMLDMEYSKSMSNTSGFGLAEQIYRQLSNSDDAKVSKIASELKKIGNKEPINKIIK
jgi:flagellar protein FlgJ